MSQTNPRKPALRTPNGTDTSPAAASSDAPAQPVPQPIHHPLPKAPHTYIPAHLKSNGPRTQYPRGRSSKSNTPGSDESPEIKAMRAKYGDKLSNLKETFGNWSDEDLLPLLAESNGNVDSVATMILEGRAEHWDSVSHKKKDKGAPTGVTGGPHTAARDRAEAGGSASPGIGGAGRGGFRGGRGGPPGRGGARGGRGGGSGGRGGYSNGSGKVALTHGVSAADGTTESAAADAWGSTDPSASTWDTDGAWGESANGASKVKEAPVPTKTPPVKGQQQQQSSKAPAKAPAPAGPPKMSWAQIAKKGKPVEPPIAPPVKAPAAVPPPSLPTPRPAEPVSEPTPSEPPAASEPEPTPFDSTTDLAEEPAATEAQPTDEDGPEEATTAPSDDWIAVTPPNQQIPVELPAVTVPVVEEPKPVEAEAKTTATEAPKAPESTPITQQPSSVSTLQPTGAPPGLSPVPQPASTPSSTTVTSPAATVASTAATSAPTKSSTPRLGSSRPASRFRTTDAPVIMPGGLPTPVFGGGLSFGNIDAGGTSFGGSGLESRFGMQFGSLSLNDDLDSNGPIEPSSPEVPAPVAQQEPPAPVTVAEPEPAPAPAPVPVQASVPTQAPVPTAQPQQPAPQPVVAPQPTVPAQPAQQSPRVLSSSTAINSLFQHAQQPAQQSLPQQVATPPSLNATQVPPPQQPTPSAPKVDALPPFLQQGAPGLLSHLHQQQSHNVQPSQQQAPASHLPPHLSQPQQLGSPAQQSQQLAASQAQQSLPYNVGGGQHLPPHLDTSSLPQTQQPASATSISAPHPALAAQNSYFRNAGADSAFYHAPTPPQTQLPQQLQQDHSSPYGVFSPLGQPQQTQGGHLGGFGSSPAGADYGYDAQRGGFYDSYAQGSNFQNRPQLAHDEPAKGGLQPSTPTNVLPGQQNLNLGQGQPGGAQSGVANPGPGFMPYHYYQQPAYFPPPVPAQYNPYSQYKYGPYSQPPPAPGGPGPQGLQGNKPPTTGTASPYGSQHYPSQSTPYDDPTSVGYQQGTTSATDYQKQQPLYGGQGLQNFFGNQGTGQNGPQLGGAQGARAGATSSSPENPYKGYGSGPGVGADKGATGQQGGTGRAAGGPGPQPQQGGYYPNNQYSAQRQPPAQGYPQGDAQQQYYSGYQPRNQYGGGW